MIVVAGSPWILAKQRRDRKIPYSAVDGYGTARRHRGSRDALTHLMDDNYDEEQSPLFLPTKDANLTMPAVGDKSVLHSFYSIHFISVIASCQTQLLQMWNKICRN